MGLAELTARRPCGALNERIQNMKKYALVAFGPGRSDIGVLFTNLYHKGCIVDSCLLTSFGPGFAATVLVLGQKNSVSSVVKALKSTLLLRMVPVEGESPALPGNLQITLYGPNRPQTLMLIADIIGSEKGEITEIESRSIGSSSVLALQAYIPGSITHARSRIRALSKELGLKSSIEKIRPEDLV